MIVTDKKFYSTLVKIAVPIAIQNLMSFMVNLIDTLMLGRLGENSLSGASLAGQLYFILMLAIAGVSEGSNVLNSQYYGKKDIKSIHKVYAIAYRGAFIFGIVATVIALLIPELFMKIYSNEPEVIEEGAKYLRIMAFSYIPFSLTTVNITMLRAVHSTKISIIVYVSSFIVNASLNYCLIFGKFGFPELGIVGAGIATVSARIIELIIVIIYLAKFEEKIKIKISYIKKIDKGILEKCIKNSVPILLNEIVWALGSTTITIIFGRLGKEVVSANAISTVMFQFVSVFLFGISSASLVTIGNVIGEGDMKKAYQYAHTYLLGSVILGTFSMVVVYLIKDNVIDFYNISEETVLIAREILKANSVILFFQTIAIVTGMGILRGGGDSKFVFYTEVVYLWGIAAPLCFIGAFVLELPIFWIYILAKTDEILKAITFTYRCLFTRWVKDITRNNID